MEDRDVVVSLFCRQKSQLRGNYATFFPPSLSKAISLFIFCLKSSLSSIRNLLTGEGYPLKAYLYSMVVFGSRKRWDRWHIIPQLAVYTTYIPLIYCLLGCYMLRTTFYGNQKQPLIYSPSLFPNQQVGPSPHLDFMKFWNGNKDLHFCLTNP